MRGARGRGAALSAAAIAVIAIVVIAAIAIPLLFLQYRALDVREERTIAAVEGAEHLRLNVSATVGELHVMFSDLPDLTARVVAEVRGQSGFFGDANPLRLDVRWHNDTGQGGSTVTAAVGFDTYAPWPYYSLRETFYTVEINRTLRSTLNLTVITGGVELATSPGVVLEGLRLNATSKGAKVSLDNGTVLAGDVKIRTATGGTMLRWNNVTVVGDRSLFLSESSGEIDARFDQVEPLGGRISVFSKATAGESHLVLTLTGDTSAHVLVNEGIGGLELINLGGFVATSDTFRSFNYPTLNSISVQVNNTIGAVVVEGRWTAS